MAGKRVKKAQRSRLPALLMLLLTSVLLVATEAPHSVAADSPVETAAAVAEPAVEAVPESPEEPAEPDDVKQPSGPVPESPPVTDTYFADAAFLGDSRTEGLKLYSGLAEGSYYHAVGATVESVFTKAVETEAGKMPLLDAMAGEDFGKIYVMLGVNELGWNGTDIFHDQYALLVDRLREDHPESIIVLQTILPVSAKQEAKETYVNNSRIADYNGVVRQLAAEKDCVYVDIASAVTDETGCLRAEWTSDGVHLNVRGCKVWLEYLRTHSVGDAAAFYETAENGPETEPVSGAEPTPETGPGAAPEETKSEQSEP